MRILIVDDSPMIWRRLFDMLGEFSYVSFLAYAANLADARTCLAGFHPELIVLDVSLPDGNGLDLLKELRVAGVRTKVAVFTNHADLRRHSLELGADWYFDKSLDYPQLLALLSDQTYWREQDATFRRPSHVGN